MPGGIAKPPTELAAGALTVAEDGGVIAGVFVEAVVDDGSEKEGVVDGAAAGAVAFCPNT